MGLSLSLSPPRTGGKDVGEWGGGRRGSYLQRSTLIKNPSAEITHPSLPCLPLLPSPLFFFSSRDNRANFLQGNDRLRHPKLSLAFPPSISLSPVQIFTSPPIIRSDPSRKANGLTVRLKRFVILWRPHHRPVGICADFT